jgi:ABC-2 type transport system permease protein
MIELAKWWATIKISWIRQTTYRINFLLLVLAPALVSYFIKYSLWSSIYSGDETKLIAGYTLKTMLAYQSFSLIVGLLGQGSNSMNLSDEIRRGKISTYLIYPFNFWEYHTASFFAFQGIQIFISAFTIILLKITGLIYFASYQSLITGILFTLYVSLFWFALQYLIGLVAFWLEETWMIRVIIMIISSFLSGAYLPLEIFPEKLVAFLEYTPFPYLSYYPIRLMMGEDLSIIKGVSILSTWLVIILFFNHLTWKKGMKLYTAAGM